MSPSNEIMPHPWYYHPEKTWLDILMTIISRWLLPFDKIVELQTEKDVLSFVESLRSKIASLESPSFRQWATTVQSEIVETVVAVPRRPLLHEWGVKVPQPVATPVSDHIPVHVFVPAKNLESSSSSVKMPSNCSAHGTFEVVLERPLEEVAEHLPVVVFFHGGGLTLGHVHEDSMVRLVAQLAQTGDFIYASVEYSLAPEYPFPNAIEEAMIVLDYFLTEHPTRPLHVAGCSAGGYLALTATLELHRRQRRGIASLLCACPMIEPCTDSPSYQANGATSYIGRDFLEWCWQSYLPHDGLRRSKSLSQLTETSVFEESTNNKMDQTLVASAELERLVYPLASVPEELDFDILLTTNRGDCLYSEGAAAAQALAKHRLRYFDHAGSHWLGTALDRAAMQELVEAWRSVVFG